MLRVQLISAMVGVPGCGGVSLRCASVGWALVFWRTPRPLSAGASLVEYLRRGRWLVAGSAAVSVCAWGGSCSRCRFLAGAAAVLLELSPRSHLEHTALFDGFLVDAQLSWLVGLHRRAAVAGASTRRDASECWPCLDWWCLVRSISCVEREFRGTVSVFGLFLCVSKIMKAGDVYRDCGLLATDSLDSSLCKQNKVEDAAQLLNKMPQWGCKPEAVTYANLIRGLCSTGSTSLGIGFLKKMKIE
ncbi:uncharacterized protein A4U43_C08F18060 [Asparagus officinalis]|nr:uncharacterized protein A4U43_C08F18060 [Asparagus officinalis]